MPGPRAIHVLALAAVLATVTIAIYAPVLHAGFIDFDDNDYITSNDHVLSGLNAASLRWALTSTDCANWHPVTWVSHLVDVQAFGLGAGRHHRTSVAIHAANVVLLFMVLVRMTGALWRSAFVACLFGVHPLHVESVAWISERKDVLSTLFWMLTLLAWLRWLDTKTVARYAVVVAVYALGLMSKPMLVTLPFTLVLLDFWPLQRATLPPLVREKAPLLLMSAASCAITFVAQRTGGAVQTLENFPFGERLANAIVVYAIYLAKTVWPTSLAVFYPYGSAGRAGVGVAAIAVALAGVTVLVLRLARTRPYLTFGWLWYLGTLVPTIGLIQVGSQSMADRYTYVPLIGIFVAVAWGLGDLAHLTRVTKRAVPAAAAVAIVTLLPVTRIQAGYWSDSVALFSHALAVTKDNWLAHSTLGGALEKEGRIDEAIAHQREALRIRPSYTEAHYNLGLVLERSRRHDEAIAEFEKALALRPSFAKAHNNLAGVLAGQGHFDQAMEHLAQAIRYEPGNTDSRFNYAGLLMAAGRAPEAIEQYEAILTLRPNDAEARDNLERARASAAAHR